MTTFVTYRDRFASHLMLLKFCWSAVTWARRRESGLAEGRPRRPSPDAGEMLLKVPTGGYVEPVPEVAFLERHN